MYNEKNDINSWKGITILAELVDKNLSKGTLELLGIGKELASKAMEPLFAIVIGFNLEDSAQELLSYGVDEIFLYDDQGLELFSPELYSEALKAFIGKKKPSVLLAPSSFLGKSLAPRAAAAFGTGLTADCTALDINEKGELIQIRPTYGGNIMAEILTSRSRPQIATVKPNIFKAAQRKETTSGKISRLPLPSVESKFKNLELNKKHQEVGITDADILVAVGRRIKDERDMDMAYDLAKALGAQLAVTRPLTEMGWATADRQIGVSGKIVKPKLIITLGISGAIQFTIGMNKAEYIIAVNKDEKAPIFKVAHYGIVGDIYEIVPHLINLIKGQEEI